MIVTTNWIDACQSKGKLLGLGGWDNNVKIFDKRKSKIFQTFDGSHKRFNKLIFRYQYYFFRMDQLYKMESKVI